MAVAPTRTDAELVRRLQARDRTAWEELYAEYQPRLRAFGYRLAGNAHDADDLVQETFVRALPALDRLDPDTVDLTAYLFTTEKNLFLKQDNGATLTLQDRVTAVGEVVRNRLANGVISHTGTVRVAKAAGCPAAPAAANANCFDLGLNQGSVMDSVPPATALTENPNWATVSMGTSNGWLRNGRTGARRLDLPIVSDGATAVDLIRRPALPPVEIGQGDPRRCARPVERNCLLRGLDGTGHVVRAQEPLRELHPERRGVRVS